MSLKKMKEKTHIWSERNLPICQPYCETQQTAAWDKTYVQKWLLNKAFHNQKIGFRFCSFYFFNPTLEKWRCVNSRTFIVLCAEKWSRDPPPRRRFHSHPQPEVDTTWRGKCFDAGAADCWLWDRPRDRLPFFFIKGIFYDFPSCL